MKHITATGCGYTLINGTTIPTGTTGWVYGRTYSCYGIPPLMKQFQTTDVVPGTTVNQYDNYYNLPQKIKGFVMTLRQDQILDMATTGGVDPSVPVPELSCEHNFDPLSGGSYTDYYAQYTDGKLRVEIQLPGGTTSAVISGSSMWSASEYTKDAVIDGSTTRVVYELAPGALEPMIDTSFPPVGVNFPPFPEINNMGGKIIDKLFTSWQDMVVEKLNNLYHASWDNISYDMSSMMNAEESSSTCPNFRITLAKTVTKIETRDEGKTSINYVTDAWIAKHKDVEYTVKGTESVTALVEGDEPWRDYRRYDVSSGTVVIDGKTVYVESITNAPYYSAEDFEVYLVINPDKLRKGEKDAVWLWDTPPGGLDLWRTDGYFYVFVGSVTRIYAEATKDSKAYTLFKITQGDCITDLSISGGTGGDGYCGPFKVSVESTTTYAVKGETISGEGITGVPLNVIGETATRDYTAYKVVVTDCSNSTPADSAGEYAGYAITGGTQFDKVGDHVLYVDSDTTAITYLLFTYKDSGWTWEYVDEPGLSQPETACVTITGETGTTILKIDDASVGQQIDGCTITAKEGSTITYIKGGTETTVESPMQYLVPLGCISYGTVGQMQYGNVYLDYQAIDGQTISTVPEYNGPFKVQLNPPPENATNYVPTYNVIGMGEPEDGTNGPYHAGWIYLNGEAAYEPESVYSKQASTDALFIYAHVSLNVFEKTEKGYEIAGQTIADYKVNDYKVTGCSFSASYTVAESSTADYTYIVRLAKLVGDHAEQIHYGDIYIDTQKLPKPPEIPAPVEAYNGPFKVEGVEGSDVPTVELIAFDGIEEGYAQLGYVVINGNTAAPFAIPKDDTQVTFEAGEEAATIYANVVLKKSATTAGDVQPYEIEGCTITVNEQLTLEQTSNDHKLYTYRLARVDIKAVQNVHDTIVTQIQHGDLYLGDVNDPIIPKLPKNPYNGPFKLNEDGSITCDVCPPSGESNQKILGYYSLDGKPPEPVKKGINFKVPLSGATTPVYLTFTAGSPVSVDIATAPDTSVTGYNVWLGYIEGATETVANGTTTYEGATNACQMHYGNVQVDGRWM